MKVVKVTFKPLTFEDFINVQRSLRQVHMTYVATFDAMPPIKFSVTCRCPTFHAEQVVSSVAQSMTSVPVVQEEERSTVTALDILASQNLGEAPKLQDNLQ